VGSAIRRAGFSLMEIMVVLVIMGILMSMAVPSFHRAIEQSRADVAGANLQAIWSAQRLYWLDNHAYTADLTLLNSLGLVDPSVVSATNVYVYAISAADANTFSATATRTGSTLWAGEFFINESGTLSGSISTIGQADIQPGFQ
jgi:prepilin-type N-terminal cleavage/methylation domain-containing protein